MIPLKASVMNLVQKKSDDEDDEDHDVNIHRPFATCQILCCFAYIISLMPHELCIIIFIYR